ncbi:MAG: GTPase ObgE [Chloroflexi bacterium]|nr:GTPase ObgE [Chloroflexota bacterium]MCI0576331.1 GTPase ObgE [Chloroflexota bacterium]MCI0650130.1 GTPase ObgE [Chloroflexota bacterium]MCI0731214.1 GTPase ObgE [Chloroflexota bacterium]
MFYDQAKIYVRSGDGGDGMISFRREKHVPRGGPDGGDGGRGGDVIFVVNPNLNSLVRFHRNVHFRAGNGGHGGRKKMSGANGDSLRLEVPPGTLIREAETGAILADLIVPDQAVVVLEGGRGGKGNTRFATSVNQAPRLAERGEPGQEAWLLLELKLIADVGIVGVPNAGKSTLLSVVSAARPKIADYPFTTLQPNLGVVELDDYETMVMADIPGLIEGAAAGAGLGHDFLRHIERTRVLVHLLDGNATDPLEDWAMINQELALYHPPLDQKPQLVALNKMDLPEAVAWKPLVRERVMAAGYPFCAISAATGQGVREMLYQAKQMVDETPPPQPAVSDVVVIRPEPDEEAFTISRQAGGWRVQGQKIERIAAMTYWEFEATARRFQHILEKMGISEALTEAGIEPGDTVYIGDEVLEWSE